jgi:hypothetical protein
MILVTLLKSIGQLNSSMGMSMTVENVDAWKMEYFFPATDAAGIFRWKIPVGRLRIISFLDNAYMRILDTPNTTLNLEG